MKVVQSDAGRTLREELLEYFTEDQFKYVPEILLDSLINDIETFDLMGFTYDKYMNNPFCEYMEMFYAICDNARFLNSALDIGFDFEIYKYIEICRDLYKKDPKLNNHHLDLFDVADVEYRNYYRKEKDGKAYIIYPYNLVSYVECGNMVPSDINTIHSIVKMHDNIDYINGLNYTISQLPSRQQEIVKLNFEQGLSCDTVANKLEVSTGLIYENRRNIARKIRSSKFYKYGYDGAFIRDKKQEEELTRFKKSQYDKAIDFLDLMNTYLEDAKYLVQFPEDRMIVGKVKKELGLQTVKDLYLCDYDNIKKVKYIGTKRAMWLNTCCRRYYNFTIPKNHSEMLDHKTEIEHCERVIKEHN